jgi:hypothetical protein
VTTKRRIDTARSELIEVPDDLDAFNRLFDERKWGDGLPLIPPTPERVDGMLRHTARARDEIVAALAPAFGEATVERIAINAVLAGCRPECLPVLLAAVEAMAAEAFNLQAMQATTNPAAVWLVVSGPVAAALGVNGELNCLGQGSWANATLGRALHLILQNIGGAYPGDIDRATHGQPAKYTFCCTENDNANPWAPLHVERGYAEDCSTVTVIGASGTLNINCHAKDAADLLRSIADSMAFPSSNDYWIGGEPWLVLGPEHAEVLHRAGLSKMEIKRRLWEESKLAAGRMAAADLARTKIARAAELGAISPETLLPISQKAEDIGILVAGGPGTHSTYVPSFGDSRSVTREVVMS